MLYREIIAVCSQIHTKHKNTLCGQSIQRVDVKSGGTHTYHCYRKRYGDISRHEIRKILVSKFSHCM